MAIRLLSAQIVRKFENRPLICTNRLGILLLQQGGAPNNYTLDDGRFVARVGRAGYHSVQLGFGNFYVAAGERIDVATITPRAAFETLTPIANRAFTFGGGVRAPLLAPGDQCLTDPMYETVSGGTDMLLRTGLTVATGGDLWPCNYTSRGAGENFRQSVGTAASSQVYNTGSLNTAGTIGSAGFGPLCAIGMPLETSDVAHRRAFISLGDSISFGNSDTADTNYNIGYGKGLVDPDGYVVPHMLQSRNSDQASFQVNATGFPMSRKLLWWRYATDFICNLGTNDGPATGNRTMDQWKADVLTILGKAKSFGLRTAWVKILPRQVSLGGAIVAGYEPGGVWRDPANAWLSSQVGLGLLDAVIDPNPFVEDPANPGKYLPGISSDGIHMNASGYALAVPAIKAYVASTM